MQKWIKRIAIGLAGVAAVLAAIVWTTALTSDHRVGFQTVTVADANGRPFEVGLWYPTEARPWPHLTGLIVQMVARDAPVSGGKHPLIVISHGVAGALSSHADTALALADAGFIVAAPLHPGDNYRDQSAVGTTNWFIDRARQLHLTISYALEQWPDRGHVDENKVGVFGFSAGGATALIAIGGQPDYDLLKAHCAKANEFACDVWRKNKPEEPSALGYVHDPRIKAAVVIAPGIGFAFANYGLAGVRVPVQLWSGAKDISVPTPTNAEPVRRELGARAEWHLVPNASHFSFMVPCGLARLVAPKMICEDPPGLDRAAFHKKFNGAVTAFFQRTLAKAPIGICIGVSPAMCFPVALSAGVEFSSMAGAFDVFGRKIPGGLSDANGFRLNIVFQDYIAEYSRIGLDSACTAHRCQFYRKACDMRNTTCFYMLYKPVGRGPNERIMTGTGLWVEARSDAMFTTLQNEVTLALDEESTERLPLRAMTQTYPIADGKPFEVTACAPDRPVPGCGPLHEGGK